MRQLTRLWTTTAALTTAVCLSCASQESTSLAQPVAAEAYAVTDDSVRLWYRVVGNGEETVMAPSASRSLAGPEWAWNSSYSRCGTRIV